MSELHIVLIAAAALIFGSLIYRKTRKQKWPEMIYGLPPHGWEGFNNGRKAIVTKNQEYPWAMMCQEVYECVSKERDFYRRNVNGWEVMTQAIMFDDPSADEERIRIRWVTSMVSQPILYRTNGRSALEVEDDMRAFRNQARDWVRKNNAKVLRP